MGAGSRSLLGCCVAASLGWGESLRRIRAREDPNEPVRIPKDKFDEYHVPEVMPKDAELEGSGRRWTPSGWIHHRKEGHRAYFDMHVPKAAGCSFSVDIKQVLADGEGYFSYESCFSGLQGEGPRDVKVAMMRQPTSHVYSQFMECKYDKDWGAVRGSDRQYLRNLSTWLRHFDGGREHNNLHCYDPYNMQAQAFSCQSERPHHYDREPDLRVAMRNMDSLFFVGIMEHYQASLCLFFARTQEGEELPEFCDCRDEQAWNSFQGTHEVHGVPPHSVSDLTAEDLRLISELTRLDEPLYQRALDRFRRESAEVERKTGTKILCER